MKTLLILIFLTLGSLHAQTVTLADGEVWTTIHPNGKTLAIEITPDMPSAGTFRTMIVIPLPESDIVGAPQSEGIIIWGDCSNKTVQVMGTIDYSGKMRGGVEIGEPTLPEGVTRRVLPNTPMFHVFNVVCAR